MGTEYVQRWYPTDSWATLEVEVFVDLEDGNEEALNQGARSLVQVQEPSEEHKVAFERHLRDLIFEAARDELSTDDDVTLKSIRIKWSRQEIEVCEWCMSPNCNGEPDSCAEAPEYCGGCDDYTNGECDCVWCDKCEDWNGDCGHGDASVEEIMNLLKSANEQVVLVVVDEDKEEETIL